LGIVPTFSYYLLAGDFLFLSNIRDKAAFAIFHRMPLFLFWWGDEEEEAEDFGQETSRGVGGDGFYDASCGAWVAGKQALGSEGIRFCGGAAGAFCGGAGEVHD
jgi:hypothetical protein